VTMATAILSAARKQPVQPDVAMTGEITLSGAVLPVGGIREKALAARRYGITTFILPERNAVDIPELPEEVRRDMTFVPVSRLSEVLARALPAPPAVEPAAAAAAPVPETARAPVAAADSADGAGDDTASETPADPQVPPDTLAS
jgi:ATP-dependent Lon protease